MQVRTLYALLGQLIEQGHGRKPVCINKRTFNHVLEDDGAVIVFDTRTQTELMRLPMVNMVI